MNPDIVQDPPSSDCLKMWEEELKIVVNQLKNAEADNAKAELTLKNASEWEAKLRALYDSLLQTLATSTDATSELKVFQTQVELVGQNTTSFRQAVEVLYCETRQTYELVETLTSTVQGLLEAVRCIGDSSLNFNDGFLKSLVEFDAKLRAVGNTRTDTLNKVIAALESAYAVEYMICNDDGLSGILEDLYQEFSGERPSETDAAGDYRTGCGCHDKDHSCTSRIDPKPTFPLDSDDFFCKTLQQRDLAASEKDAAAAAYTTTRKARDRTLAHKIGLEKAIAAAKEAKK